MTMFASVSNRFATLSAAIMLAFIASGQTLHAQSDRSEPTIAVVTGDSVLVRSGAADSYYPFGRLNSGAIVEVIGEKSNWAHIATRGPAFVAGTGAGQFFGHIMYPASEPGRFRVNADGRTGVTLGPTDVLAPNLTTNFNPDDSWKPLIRLEADTTVRILSTTTTESNNTVHLIALPANAEGWISRAHLRSATAEEVAAWRGGSGMANVRGNQPRESEKSNPPKRDQPVEEKPADPQARDQSQEPAETETPEEATANTTAAPTQQVLAREESIAEEDASSHEEEPTEPLVEEVDKATIEDLEVLLQKLREAPAEISELANLRQMYLEFATRNANEKSASRFANARAEQLEIWREVRVRQVELQRIRERSRRTGQRTEMALLSIHAHADYDVIGRLTASTIFDGQRLPKMLRLQEPGTNRTLAYIEPSGHGFEMIEMLGLWLGIVGEKSYDPALRLNIITPKRIDLLAPAQ